MKRILADEAAGALLQGVLRTAFADAGDPRVGLDRHDHVALVEERVEVRRLVDPDARNLRARQGRGRGVADVHHRDCGRDRQRFEEGSSVHGVRLLRNSDGASARRVKRAMCTAPLKKNTLLIRTPTDVCPWPCGARWSSADPSLTPST